MAAQRTVDHECKLLQRQSPSEAVGLSRFLGDYQMRKGTGDPYKQDKEQIKSGNMKRQRAEKSKEDSTEMSSRNANEKKGSQRA